MSFRTRVSDVGDSFNFAWYQARKIQKLRKALREVDRELEDAHDTIVHLRAEVVEARKQILAGL